MKVILTVFTSMLLLGIGIATACTSTDQNRAVSVATCVIPKLDALPSDPGQVTVGQVGELLECRNAGAREGTTELLNRPRGDAGQ